MKKIFIILAATLCIFAAKAQPTEVKPTVKTPTSFAIFIDRASYDKCRAAVEDYRAAVEADGLATYIISDDWQSPEPVRDRIRQLAASKTMPLEGVVFIGEVPIAMLRDAQHLSSAFKMSQTSDWKDSSIPSDRFYDDFDLAFNFIRRDDDNALYFYYSLDKNSAQHICSDIYSARIRPIVREGVDKYEELTAYLHKAAKQHHETNRLDNMFVFCGHGYNSESYDAWSGELASLRQQLPSMTAAGHRITCSTFESRFPMKRYVLQNVQNEDVDVALCHHHGSEDAQYINGYQSVSYASASIDNVKRYLRSKTVGYKNQEERVADYMKNFDVPRSWFDLSDSTRMADSLYNYELDIHLEDIYASKPNARFVMFDACYNGSFHIDQYIAGAYIFGGGKTVTTMANSVNSLQDKWPDRYIGLLACGVRIGQWARNTFYLESHIIGDPTMHFDNVEKAEALNEQITLRRHDNKFWLTMLRKSTYPDIQALALRYLSENGYDGIVKLLNDTYYASPYGSVRMECVKLLSTKHCPEFVALLPAAMNDDYELVRRMAAQYIGRCGDDSLIEAEVKSLINDNLSQRVNYHTLDAMVMFDAEKIKAEIARQYDADPSIAFGSDNKASYLGRVTSTAESVDKDIEYIFNTENTLKRRMTEVGTFRNYNYHIAVPHLIRLAQDKEQDPELRLKAVEALGWFIYSYRLPEIVEACRKIAADEKVESIKDEAEKTINRLAAY